MNLPNVPDDQTKYTGDGLARARRSRRAPAPYDFIAMEGPQIRVYRDRLRRLAGQMILAVGGERAAAAAPFVGRPLPRAQSRGKLLYLPFGAEALRIHCLMFGDVRVNATRPGKRLTLRLSLPRDFVEVSLGAVQRVPASRLDEFPRTRDLIDRAWDPAAAWRLARRTLPEAHLTDALLDQTVFPGLGNKIKNEALFAARLHPMRTVRDTSAAEARRLMSAVRDVARLMQRTFARGEHIQPHMQIYRRRTCPACGGTVTRLDMGVLNRRNHFCPKCQKA